MSVPPTPISFAEISAIGEIRLQWQNSSGWTGTEYRLDRSPEFIIGPSAVVTSNQYNDSNVALFTNYFYSLFTINNATDSSGNVYYESSPSVSLDARYVNPLSNPPRPVNIVGSNTSASGIAFSWSNSGGWTNTNYRIDRIPQFPTGPSLSTFISSYTDSTAENLSTYSYSLYTINGASDPISNFFLLSSPSVSSLARYVNAGSTPPALASLTTSNLGTAIQISWSNAAGWSDNKYRIDRIPGTVGYLLTGSNLTDSSGLTHLQEYTYKAYALSSIRTVPPAPPGFSVFVSSPFISTNIVFINQTDQSFPQSTINFSGSNYNNNVRLNWQNGGGWLGTNYRLDRFNSLGGLDYSISTLTNIYTDSSVANLSNYLYIVYSVNGVTDSFNKFTLLSSFSTLTTVQHIRAPASLTVSNLLSNVGLSFTPVAGISQYDIYRNNNLVSTFGSGTTTGIDGPFTNIQDLVYRVESRFSSNTSFNTNNVNNSYIPPPQNLVLNISSNTEYISWDPILGVNLSTLVFINNVPFTLVDRNELFYYPPVGINYSAYEFASRYSNTIGIYNSVRSLPISSINLAVPTLNSLSNSSASTINVTWFGSAFATQYFIHRNDEYYASTILSILSYDDTSTVGGITYNYKVQSLNSTYGRESEKSDSLSIVRLEKPQGLIGTNQTAFIKVQWNAVAGATAYELYKNLSPVPLLIVGTSQSYDDYAVANNVVYLYRIIAVNGPYRSVISDIISIHYFIAPVISNLSIGVSISWTAITGATSYKVVRDSVSTIATVLAPTLNYVDLSNIGGISYEYKIEAYNGAALITTSASASILYLTQPTPPIITNGSNFINLFINSVVGATYYNVIRNGVQYVTIPVVSYNDTNVSHGSLYSYIIIAGNGDTLSIPSLQVENIYLHPPTLTNIVSSVQINVSSISVLNAAYGISTINIFRTDTQGIFASTIATNNFDTSVSSVKYYQYKYGTRSSFGISTYTSAFSEIYHISRPEISTSVFIYSKGISVVWNSVGAQSYTLYRNSTILSSINATEATSITYTDYDILTTQVYSYYVRGNAFGYTSEFSEPSNIQYLGPMGALVRSVGILIFLGYEVIGASGYLLYRNNVLINVSTFPETYLDPTVQNNQVYEYKYRILIGSTFYDTIVTSVRFVSAPSNFALTTETPSDLIFTWDPVPHIDSYSVYNEYDQVVATTTDTFIVFPNLLTYVYCVKARIGDSESAKSNTVYKYTTPTPPGYQYYPSSRWVRTLNAAEFIGSPSIIAGTDNSIFFAVSTRGTLINGISTLQTAFPIGHRIVLGCYDKDGNLAWTFQHPSLHSTGNDIEPVITFGDSGEIYLAYVVEGQLFDRYNMTDVVNFCGPCGTCTACGGPREPRDIVLARIDGVLSGNPTITWRIQDANINSCSDETVPTIAFDTYNRRIILAYQTNSKTLCDAYTVGQPNIVVNSIDANGVRQWSYQDTNVNSVEQNQKPSISADASGNVYLAYTVTQAVSGGNKVGTRDVEIIKIHAEKLFEHLDPIPVRDWILSAATLINSTGENTNPSVKCYPGKNSLYITFKTTGTVPGSSQKTSPAGKSDIVFAAIDLKGNLKWLQQDSQNNLYNNNVNAAQITSDRYGVIYSAAGGYETASTFSSEPLTIPRNTIHAINPETSAPIWKFFSTQTSLFDPPTKLLSYYILNTTQYSINPLISLNVSSIAVPSIGIYDPQYLYASGVINNNMLYTASVNPFSKYIQTSNGVVLVPALSTVVGELWEPTGLLDNKFNWIDIDCSSNGQYVYSAANFIVNTPGILYRSLDYGSNWGPVINLGNIRSVACSYPGDRIIAVVFGQRPYYSSDYGNSWSAGDTVNRGWINVDVSSNGNTCLGVTTVNILTSYNGGISWTIRDVVRNWTNGTVSADGMIMYATVSSDRIYKSINSGVNWNVTTSPTDNWQGIDCSADGNIVVACALGNYIYVSSDAGSSWSAKATGFGVQNWKSVSCSPNGSNMMASFYQSGITGPAVYSSSNAGQTWALNNQLAFDQNDQTWNGIAFNYDGSKCYANFGNGRNYYSSNAMLPINNYGNIWKSDNLQSITILPNLPNLTTIYISNTGTLMLTGGITSYSWLRNDYYERELYAANLANNYRSYKQIVTDWNGNNAYAIVARNSFILRATQFDAKPTIQFQQIAWTQFNLSSFTSIFNFKDVCCGYDGSKVFTVSQFSITSNTVIHRSVNYGSNWSLLNEWPGTDLALLRCSWDGINTFTAGNGTFIYKSIDSGASWTPSYSVSKAWTGLTVSPDCTIAYACANSDYLFKTINFGVSWSPIVSAGIKNWIGIDMSSDGSVIVTAASNDYIYYSIDYGVSWSPAYGAGIRPWTSVSMDGQGISMGACSSDGYVYESKTILMNVTL
jgi:hypothetical protein